MPFHRMQHQNFPLLNLSCHLEIASIPSFRSDELVKFMNLLYHLMNCTSKVVSCGSWNETLLTSSSYRSNPFLLWFQARKFDRMWIMAQSDRMSLLMYFVARILIEEYDRFFFLSSSGNVLNSVEIWIIVFGFWTEQAEPKRLNIPSSIAFGW